MMKLLGKEIQTSIMYKDLKKNMTTIRKIIRNYKKELNGTSKDETYNF